MLAIAPALTAAYAPPPIPVTVFPGADTQGIVCRDRRRLAHDPRIDAKVRTFINQAQDGVFDPALVSPVLAYLGTSMQRFFRQIGPFSRLEFRTADEACSGSSRGYTYKVVASKATAGLTIEFNRVGS